MNPTDFPQTQAIPDRKAADIDSVRAALRIRLSLAIKRAIEERGITHADAALIARTPRTSVTAIANGNLERVSMDRLVTIAHRLGVQISLRLTTPSSI
jgi:predicted XRE-type DNA-binding protein